MRRIRRFLPVVVSVLAAGLTTVPAAVADDFDTIFKSYQKTGKVDPCKFSAGQLKKAGGQVPNDIEQYAPDFPAALDAAAEKRASGACDKKASTNATGAAPAGGTGTGAAAASGPTATTGTPPAGAVPPAATPAPAGTPTPAPGAADSAIKTAADSKGDAGTPAALVALAIVGGLLALGALLWGAARWWAWEPGWLIRARHAAAEAGWRTSAAWAEFTDWVRLGR